MNKIRSDIVTEKRKQKKKQQLEELTKLMSVESSRLNSPNVIESNILLLGALNEFKVYQKN